MSDVCFCAVPKCGSCGAAQFILCRARVQCLARSLRFRDPSNRMWCICIRIGAILLLSTYCCGAPCRLSFFFCISNGMGYYLNYMHAKCDMRVLVHTTYTSI